MGFTLILGGARSGKSDMAHRLGVESGRRVTFIATATAGDEEMAERIARHRHQRPPDWATVEAPVDLEAALESSPADGFVVLDCLTLWVSNLLGDGRSIEEIARLGDSLARRMSTLDGVVVTNEVGLGIVPANSMARAFRDTLGIVNATFARCAERTVLMVAGRALDLS